MKNYELYEVLDKNVKEALQVLESMLIPSLTERKINIVQYSLKLSTYGKVWCHYDKKIPISIIAGYFNDKKSQTAYISTLIVAKEYRGKKLASSLIVLFENYAFQNGLTNVKLEVRKNNVVAQNLYKKFGYEVIEEASETTYYMEKQLENFREEEESGK